MLSFMDTNLLDYRNHKAVSSDGAFVDYLPNFMIAQKLLFDMAAFMNLLPLQDRQKN